MKTADRISPCASSLWICSIVWALSLPVCAQSPDTGQCTVSVLNQTAKVQAGGIWNLPNVPANMGPVRARVTCVDDGQTLSGASDFFTITQNRMNAIPRVELCQGAATPQAIRFGLPETTLTTAGQTVQGTVTAHYPDGSARDVTAAAEGTIYFTSSPTVATVGLDGLVTAFSSGRVLVSALHEAILDSVSILVLTSGDTDGDGMPDDFELSSGLDPNDPVDALEDRDRDGLLNGQEFDLGTDVNTADTDGDGITDGEELVAGADGFLTNPLLADTDGDGVRDRLEIRVATDPTDPQSVDYAAVLVALRVEPDGFTLVKNTILPDEVSRRVRVFGRLVDGTTADLTARRTTYSSSNLAVASFDAEPGRIFAGADGSTTVTATNGGFRAQIQVNVTTFSPRVLSFLPIPGFANGVAVDGSTVCVAAGITGLQVIDASDLQAPRIVGALDTPGNANDVFFEDGYAYVADGDRGLQVIDVSIPSAPVLVGGVDTPGIATDIVVTADRAYVADGAAGLAVIDVADPAAPRLLGRVDTPGNARGVDVEGSFVLVADAAGGVHVVDVGNPAAPLISGTARTRATFSRAADVVAQGRLAYVADGSDSTLGGLRIIDWSDPRTPALVASTTDQFGLAALALDRNVALAADYFFVNAVPVFDLRQTAPAIRGTLDFSRAPSFRDDNGHGIAVQAGVAYLVAGSAITDNGVTGNTGLHIGRYALREDAGGITPTVRLTAPAGGSSILERRRLRLAATASDDVLVDSVVFLVDGEPVGRDFSPPYELDFLVPSGAGVLTLGAVASDLGGNQGFAEERTIQVLPDTAPTITFTAPLAGSHVTEGTTLSIAASATDDDAVASVAFWVDGIPAGSRSTPPYRVDVAVPIGATQLTLSAVATDNVGQQSAPASAVVGVDPNQPPAVEILQPLDGSEIVEGSTMRIVAGASDDVAVARVRFTIDGAVIAEDLTAPFELPFSVPLGAAQLSLGAEAVDALGLSATAPEVSVLVIPDPGTTVRGTVVLEDGAPVPDATVSVGALTTTSASDGSFELTGVPTVQGSITVSAIALVDGQTFRGSTAAVEPVPDGFTEVGEIVLSGSRIVGYYDLSLNRGSAVQVAPILAAGLEARDIGNLSTADLGQVGLLFVQNPSNTAFTATYLNNRPRLYEWIEGGGVLVFHDRHVSTAANILPGSPGTFVRSTSSQIDVIDATTLVTDGPEGTLDNASLDGGNFSNHGYVLAASMPIGARAILSNGNPGQVVTYAYPYGAGWVVYSTIPLDFYLSGGGLAALRDRFRLVYAPNVLAYANNLR